MKDLVIGVVVLAVGFGLAYHAARLVSPPKAPAQVEAASPEPCCGGGCCNEIPPEAGTP